MDAKQKLVMLLASFEKLNKRYPKATPYDQNVIFTHIAGLDIRYGWFYELANEIWNQDAIIEASDQERALTVGLLYVALHAGGEILVDDTGNGYIYCRYCSNPSEQVRVFQGDYVHKPNCLFVMIEGLLTAIKTGQPVKNVDEIAAQIDNWVGSTGLGWSDSWERLRATLVEKGDVLAKQNPTDIPKTE